MALDVRETADQHHELGVGVAFGDLLAGEFNVAEPQAEPLSRPAKALTRVLHAMILSRVVDCWRLWHGSPFLKGIISSMLFPVQQNSQCAVLKSEQNRVTGERI